MIRVEHLTKSFRDLRRGQVLAVDDLCFEARPGEVFGLLGPNGAGKTTAMRILCTVLRPTSGTAWIAGYDVVAQPAQVRQHIGFMSVNTAIYDRMSAWELVEYFGRLYGMTEERLQARLEEVFTILQMNDFRDMLGAKMSTGMRQKVSIARAIIHDPPVMIFDEPTAGLDVLVSRAVMHNIEAPARAGEVHSVLHAHHARSGTSLRPGRHHGQGTHSGDRDAGRAARPLPGEGSGRTVLSARVLKARKKSGVRRLSPPDTAFVFSRPKIRINTLGRLERRRGRRSRRRNRSRPAKN